MAMLLRPENCPRCIQFKRMRKIHHARRAMRLQQVPETELPKFMESTLPFQKNCIGCQDRIDKNRVCRERYGAKRLQNRRLP